MFKHLPDFTRSVRREKRAVGPFSTLLYNKNAIFMPRKQSASLHWRGKWKAGAAATLRLPTHGPARGAPTPCEDRAEALSHVIPTGCWASWDLRGVLLVSPEESLVFPQHLTGGGGDCPRVTVWHTHSQARTEQRDVHNSVYSASFCLCSVWMAKLKNKYKSIENSEVACICINFFFFY